MRLNELEQLKKTSKKICNENKNVFDVVLFGSSVKGKFKPGDIDLCVVFKNKISQQGVINILNLLKPFHVEHLFLDELYK